MLKTVSSVTNAIGALNYKGTWNANTNDPTLTSSVGVKGDYYVVSVAGTTDLNGITDWQVNDIAAFNGAIWQKIDNTDQVVSVNGQQGAVVLTAPDVGATANTTYVLTSGLLSGGGQLNANVTISLVDVPSANVSGLGTMAVQNANAVAITGGNVTANIGMINTTAANATFAVANLPLDPEGYVIVTIGGVAKKIPYYGV